MDLQCAALTCNIEVMMKLLVAMCPESELLQFSNLYDFFNLSFQILAPRGSFIRRTSLCSFFIPKKSCSFGVTADANHVSKIFPMIYGNCEISLKSCKSSKSGTNKQLVCV